MTTIAIEMKIKKRIKEKPFNLNCLKLKILFRIKIITGIKIVCFVHDKKVNDCLMNE